MKHLPRNTSTAPVRDALSDRHDPLLAIRRSFNDDQQIPFARTQTMRARRLARIPRSDFLSKV